MTIAEGRRWLAPLCWTIRPIEGSTETSMPGLAMQCLISPDEGVRFN